MADALEVVRAYHQRTKHHPQRYAAGPHGLDWANQPDPFRRYAGAPLVELELPPEEGGPSWCQARGGSLEPRPLDGRSLSELLYDSLALSAWKQAGESRWALRVNPSSGNLHPTEAYLIAPTIPGLTDGPTVSHYAPREHGLELLARVPEDLHRTFTEGLAPGSLVGVLTSIDWREAWKYGERAYRYCNHDAGHALAALALAAAARGWHARLVEAPSSADLARLVGVHRQSGPEAEEAELLVALEPRPGGPWSAAVPEGWDGLGWVGLANRLSPEHVDWGVIDAVRAATRKTRGAPQPAARRRGEDPAGPDPSLRALVRGRRSAVAMDGASGLDTASFAGLVGPTLDLDRAPLASLPWRPAVHLALFVHRVEGLEPGLYLLLRDRAREADLRAALRPEFLWEPAPGVGDLPLFLLLPRDLRGAAALISCQQAIAGDSAFSLGMLADFAGLEAHGPWFYPRLYWETGAVGQVLYLEAERHGLRATGIGCFFDDAMHQLLGLSSHAWQSLYHFTVGGAVDDARLSTLPAYRRPGWTGPPATW